MFMSEQQRKIWQEIEHLQEELHKVVSKKGISSPEAVRVSQAFRSKMQEYIDLE